MSTSEAAAHPGDAKHPGLSHRLPDLQGIQRIAIVGCSGAGKSTLAKRLGARLGRDVIHLDSLFWEPGWKEASTATFRDRVALQYSRTAGSPMAESRIWFYHRPSWSSGSRPALAMRGPRAMAAGDALGKIACRYGPRLPRALRPRADGFYLEFRPFWVAETRRAPGPIRSWYSRSARIELRPLTTRFTAHPAADLW